MAFKFAVLLSVFTLSNAAPVWFGNVPQPSVSFGYGSGFSSNIGGISHSSGTGLAYRSGNGIAYGSGLAGNNYAQGVGYAESNPTPVYQAQAYPLPLQPQPAHQQPAHPQPLHPQPAHPQPAQHQPALISYYPNKFNSATSSAQNIGIGSTISNSQTHNGYGSANSAATGLGPYQSSSSLAQNANRLGYGTAVSNANSQGQGYGTAITAAENNANYQSSIALAQRQTGPLNYGTAIAASQNNGAYRSSVAEAVHQTPNSYQNAGASSFNSPGLQTAHSHAIQTGFY